MSSSNSSRRGKAFGKYPKSKPLAPVKPQMQPPKGMQAVQDGTSTDAKRDEQVEEEQGKVAIGLDTISPFTHPGLPVPRLAELLNLGPPNNPTLE